jgi:hypothetical protein
MQTFQKLWENIQAKKLVKENEEEKRCIDAIKIGTSIDEDFWDNFLSILNNGEGVAELLDVPYEKVITWNDRIRDALEKAKAEQTPPGKNKKIMKTGMNIDQEEQPEIPEETQDE